MIVAEIGGDADVGAAEAAVVAAEADVPADQAAEICLRRNMLRHKAATAKIAAATKTAAIAAVTIGAARVAISTIARREAVMASRALQVRPDRPRKNSSSRASLSQNSEIALPLPRRLLPWRSKSATNHSRYFRKRLSRAAQRFCPAHLPRLAVRVDRCRAGSLPVLAQNPPKLQVNKPTR